MGQIGAGGNKSTSASGNEEKISANPDSAIASNEVGVMKDDHWSLPLTQGSSLADEKLCAKHAISCYIGMSNMNGSTCPSQLPSSSQ